jgi:hypothetical protein
MALRVWVEAVKQKFVSLPCEQIKDINVGQIINLAKLF